MNDKNPSKSHTIRFPMVIYEAIKEMAVTERRTFNAQVIHLLELGILSCVKSKNLQERKADDPLS